MDRSDFISFERLNHYFEKKKFFQIQNEMRKFMCMSILKHFVCRENFPFATSKFMAFMIRNEDIFLYIFSDVFNSAKDTLKKTFEISEAKNLINVNETSMYCTMNVQTVMRIFSADQYILPKENAALKKYVVEHRYDTVQQRTCPAHACSCLPRVELYLRVSPVMFISELCRNSVVLRQRKDIQILNFVWAQKMKSILTTATKLWSEKFCCVLRTAQGIIVFFNFYEMKKKIEMIDPFDSFLATMSMSYK